MAIERVYVVCDKCQKPTRTEAVAEPETFADTSNLFRNNETRCPRCGNLILWSKAELLPESVARKRFPSAVKEAKKPKKAK